MDTSKPSMRSSPWIVKEQGVAGSPLRVRRVSRAAVPFMTAVS